MDKFDDNDQIFDVKQIKNIEGSLDLLSAEDYMELANSINKIETIPDQSFRIPHGDKNFRRLTNTFLGDLLHHIQKGLNTKNLCCLQLITGEKHKCLYFDAESKYYEYPENRNCEECLSRWMNSDKW